MNRLCPSVLPARSGLTFTLLLTALTAPLYAQPFGQNQVRYQTFDFKILKTQHFDIHYYEEEARAAAIAAQMAERWYTRLSEVLHHNLPPNQPVILYDSHPAFRQNTIIPYIGVGTGGVTEGIKRRVIMPFAGPLADTDHVLGHELVHAFQYDMTSGKGDTVDNNAPGAASLPLWFIEGMAEYLSVGHVDPNTAMWLRDAVSRDKLPGLKELNDPEFFPYRFGQAFWSYVGGRYGDAVVGQMLLAAGRRGNPEAAIQRILKIGPDELIKQWHQALRDLYAPVLAATAPPGEHATPVLESKKEASLNVSPALSPDGKHAVIFSERDLFAIEMFVVDVEARRIGRKLTSTAISPHFDSLEFIYATGAWSSDGSRFAVPALHDGKPSIEIFNPATGDRDERIEIPGVSEILHLDWSPNDSELVFTAMRGGVTDLFIVTRAGGKVRELTNDVFAELHPAWSPDGGRVAFTTDRFTTNPDTLDFGDFAVALLDLRGNAVSQVSPAGPGKSMNPNWGADGNTIYYISDAGGVSNIYRIASPGAAAARVTRIETGITGIAHSSPALSVAAKQGSAVFTVFDEGGYGLYTLARKDLEQRNLETNYSREQAASLPPLNRTGNFVERALDQPSAGLPQTSSFTRTDYKPKLQLDYFSQPQVGLGVGNYGAQLGGGLAFVFSDMLNRHQLVTAIQTTSTSLNHPLRNLGGSVMYINRKYRWDLGVYGGQMPYASTFYDSFAEVEDGVPIGAERQQIFWQTSREVGGIAAYPFNRAMRVEFTTGFRNLSFAAEQTTQFFDLRTNQFLGVQREDIDAPPSINLGMASAALVYDTSIFGGVSPIWGQRYRLEFSGNQGSLSFTTAMLDYRKYIRLPGNIALAGRVLHFGRYGGGAEDPRQQDLFLGYPAILRGYGAGTFTAEECGDSLQQDGSCPVVDQLLGSKMAVGNAEVRFPLIGALGLIPKTRGLPPVEIAPFADIGIAWRRNERAAIFRDGSRDPVKSYGATLRANLLGFAIGQFSLARPVDRPAKNWVFEFALIAGF